MYEETNWIRQMIALTNLSEICSRNNWYNSLILSEDITILAIDSNGVDLGKKKVRKSEHKQETNSNLNMDYKIDV